MSTKKILSKDTLFNQYQLFVESAEKNSDRRI